MSSTTEHRMPESRNIGRGRESCPEAPVSRETGLLRAGASPWATVRPQGPPRALAAWPRTCWPDVGVGFHAAPQQELTGAHEYAGAPHRRTHTFPHGNGGNALATAGSPCWHCGAGRRGERKPMFQSSPDVLKIPSTSPFTRLVTVPDASWAQPGP